MKLWAVIAPLWVAVVVGMHHLALHDPPKVERFKEPCLWQPGLAESQCVEGRSIYNRQGGRWVYAGPVTSADPHLPKGDR